MDPALVLTLMLELAVAAVFLLFRVERHIASLEDATDDPTG